jgi:hypothetical protein
MSSPQITTQLKRKKKPHEKFIQTTQFGSTPSELTIEAKDTTVKVKSLKQNPEKFSFGKVAFQNGTLEAYQYPKRDSNSVLINFTPIHFAKTSQMSVLKRKQREILALISKIGYYQSLSRSKKLIYLRNHGYSANIDIGKDTQ